MEREKVIICLCDITGIFGKDFADAGFKVILVDPQHEVTRFHGNYYKIADTVEGSINKIISYCKGKDVKFLASFPPCTDLAVSGAAHFESKRLKDPHFQAKAFQVVTQCAMLGEFFQVPYFVENPVSVLSSMWRKPDFSFHPYEYGGYLPEDDIHPEYPDYILPRDSYAKKTCLWTGGGFSMPIKKPVNLTGSKGQGQSDAHNKLGGKSLKTKNIRSATPRGFSKAVFEMYSKDKKNAVHVNTHQLELFN